MLPPRMDELINAILDGEASEADIAELDALLENDDELAAQLADRVAEHRLLGLLHQPFDEGMCAGAVMDAIGAEERAASDRIAEQLRLPVWEDAVRPNTSKYLLGVAIGVALSLLVVGIVWLAFGPFSGDGGDRTTADRGTDSSPASDVPVATLILGEGCVWRAGTEIEEGQRLSARRLDLESGLAVVRFDGGAELVMTGETSLVLRSPTRAELRRGEVVVRAEDGADGFELKTPASPLVDLGTEFAVRVDRAGTTELHVLDGEVEYLEGDSPDVLPAGKAIRFGGSNKAVEAVPLDSPRFAEVVKRANPKPQPQRMFAYDGFHYEPGKRPLAETTKGKGWAGPWRLRLPAERRLPATENSPTTFDIVHGQMNVTWPVPGGRKGMLRLPAGRVYYVRSLKRSIDTDRDGVTYFSLMVHETKRPSTKRRPRERVRMTLRSSSDYFSQYISFGHGSGFRPRVMTGKGMLHASALVLPAEQTTLWIGKIVSRARGEDEIYFRVYGEEDVLGYAEPATWHVVTRGVELDAHLDCVLLSSEGTTARIIDELRIGPTWRSVAPMLEEKE